MTSPVIETRVTTLTHLSGLPVSCYTRGEVRYFVFGPPNKPVKTVCTYRKARVFAEGMAVSRNLDAVREFQEPHVMTEAEAAALSGPPNRPTIPVKICPVKTCPPRPRMTLTKTINYKVHVKTATEAQATLRLNATPTAGLIAAALWLEKVSVPEPADEADHKRWERASLRFDNLIQLVKLAEIKVPEAGGSHNNVVRVAGVEIGHVAINAYEAWTK